MTRQDFFEQALLSTKSIDIANDLLKARDEARNCAGERKDIEDFASATENFLVVTLITPFGKVPAFLEKSMYGDYVEWFKAKDQYGISIEKREFLIA